MLSIVIPTDSTEPDSYFSKTLKSIPTGSDVEFIFVSKSEARSRAERLNLGFHRSKGEIILFHHPRSFIEQGGILFLIEMSQNRNRDSFWGGFTHKFDRDHYLLRFTSWYSNQIRGKVKGILYLDHCIFFDRTLWDKDLPSVEIFEDTILSYNFKKFSRPIVLPFISETSSIRFQKNGIWKQCLLNQFLKIAFYMNINYNFLNNIYEKDLGLNDGYSDKQT